MQTWTGLHGEKTIALRIKVVDNAVGAGGHWFISPLGRVSPCVLYDDGHLRTDTCLSPTGGSRHAENHANRQNGGGFHQALLLKGGAPLAAIRARRHRTCTCPTRSFALICQLWPLLPRPASRNGAAQIAFFALQVTAEVFDTGFRQVVHAHRNEHWPNASSSCSRSLEIALRVAKFDPIPLRLNKKLLGIRIVLQACFDLPVKLVELFVGFFE